VHVWYDLHYQDVSSCPLDFAAAASDCLILTKLGQLSFKQRATNSVSEDLIEQWFVN
jgi:hypothetical protein